MGYSTMTKCTCLDGRLYMMRLEIHWLHSDDYSRVVSRTVRLFPDRDAVAIYMREKIQVPWYIANKARHSWRWHFKDMKYTLRRELVWDPGYIARLNF